METTRYRAFVCGLIFAIVACVGGEARSMDLRGIQQLRNQRLYRAAEQECIKALSPVDLSDSEAALLTVELLRTYSGLALDSKFDERNAIWTKAENYVEQFDRRFNDSPFAAIVHLQYGTLLNLQATIERIENKVRGELQYQSAKGFSRKAIRSLNSTLSEIATIRPSSSSKRGLNSSQIAQLRHKTRRELGLAHENYSQCFAHESDDEISQLTQSVQHFESLARLAAFPKMATESQLHLARCHRLLGNWVTTNKILSHLEARAETSVQTKIATATERTHFYLDQGDLQAAMRTCETVFPVEGVDISTIAEYELAKLRTLVLICQQNKEPKNSPRRQRVNQIANNIGKRFSLYWKTRTEDHLALIQPRAVSAVTAFERKAQSAFRAGNVDESLRLFVQAAQVAEENGGQEQSLKLLHTAGAIAHQGKRYREARELLRDAALRFKTQQRAPDVHLLSIVDAAQVARSQRAVDVETYSDYLSEHLQLWPDSETCKQVRSWYAKLLFQQRKWRAALNAFLHVDSSSSEYDSIFASISTCCFQILDSVSGDDRIDELNWIDNQLSSFAKRNSKTTSKSNQRAMVNAELLRIALRLELSPGTPATEKRLQDIAATFPSDDISVEANRCLALYYCNNRRFHDAKDSLTDISLTNTPGLFRLLMRVFQSIQPVSPQLRTQSAVVLIPTANELLKRELNSSQRQRTRIVLANALHFSGERSEAISLARRLEKEAPRNGEVRELLATLLQDSDDSSQIAKAIREWRAVVNGSKPGSDRWFRAKLSIAECYFRTDQHQKAADVIRLTQTLHPKLGGDQLKRRFQNLLRMADRAGEQQ